MSHFLHSAYIPPLTSRKSKSCVSQHRPSVHHDDGTPSLAACGAMQLLAASRTLPLLRAPAVICWGIYSDCFFALALCALHEGDAQLVPSRLSRSFSATEGVTQRPFGQLFSTPTKDPAGRHAYTTTLPRPATSVHATTICNVLSVVVDQPLELELQAAIRQLSLKGVSTQSSVCWQGHPAANVTRLQSQ